MFFVLVFGELSTIANSMIPGDGNYILGDLGMDGYIYYYCHFIARLFRFCFQRSTTCRVMRVGEIERGVLAG